MPRGVIAAASVVLGLELLTDYLVQDYDFGPVGLTLESSFVVWPRPGGIAFVVSSLCCAYLVLRLCLAAEARWRDGLAFDWLARTGRLSLTIYFAHIWALLIAEHHGWFLYHELGAVLGYGALLFIACGAVARWWTLRYEHGPIEVVLRQVADPPEVAPTRPRVV